MNTENLARIVAGNPNLLTEQQAANYLTLAPGTLSVWRSTGRNNLPFVKIGGSVRYRLSDLDAWMASRERASGSTE